MNNQPGLTIDLRPLNAAMASYAAYTGKDLAYSLNRAMKNIAFKAIGRVKIAMVHAIQMLYGQPKLFAWMLRKRAESGRGGFSQRHHTERVQIGTYKKGKKAGQAKFGSASVLNYGSVGKYYSADYAAEFADKVIQARKRHIGFVRSFYLRLARAIQASIPGGGQSLGGRNIKEIVPTIKLATPSNLVVDVMAVYNFKRSKTNSSMVENMLNAALEPAINDVMADVTKYIEDGLSKRARAISVAY